MKNKPCPHCNGTGKVPDDAAIGKRLRALRLSKNVTLREMARRLGVSVMWLSDLERGKRYWKAWEKRFEEAL